MHLVPWRAADHCTSSSRCRDEALRLVAKCSQPVVRSRHPRRPDFRADAPNVPLWPQPPPPPPPLSARLRNISFSFRSAAHWITDAAVESPLRHSFLPTNRAADGGGGEIRPWTSCFIHSASAPWLFKNRVLLLIGGPSMSCVCGERYQLSPGGLPR